MTEKYANAEKKYEKIVNREMPEFKELLDKAISSPSLPQKQQAKRSGGKRTHPHN